MTAKNILSGRAEALAADDPTFDAATLNDSGFVLDDDVSFDGDPMSYTDEALTLQQLLTRNEARLQTTLNNSFFSLLRRRGIDNERKRVAMREAIWSAESARARTLDEHNRNVQKYQVQYFRDRRAHGH